MADQVVIRPFAHTDQSSVAKLWKVSFPDDPPWNEAADVIARKLLIQRELFFVATISNQVVGTVLAGYDGVRGWVHKLAVDPAHQRKGIARLLMKSAELGLASKGCPKVNLQVRASNAAVVDFYEAAGYSTEDRISMGKRL
jgi:ribosomal protein S18 acetylase RimI-like enzyme